MKTVIPTDRPRLHLLELSTSLLQPTIATFTTISTSTREILELIPSRHTYKDATTIAIPRLHPTITTACNRRTIILAHRPRRRRLRIPTILELHHPLQQQQQQQRQAVTLERRRRPQRNQTITIIRLKALYPEEPTEAAAATLERLPLLHRLHKIPTATLLHRPTTILERHPRREIRLRLRRLLPNRVLLRRT